MKITFQKSDTSDTEKYVKLYRKCFHKYPTKKNSVYFDWLYNQNPLGKFIGIDAFEGETLIGQVGGIPQEFNYMNEKIKTLLSINVCVDPKHRGKNLFSEMANRLVEYARDESYLYIIAVCNKFSTYTFKKSINMDYISSLDVLLGYGNLGLHKFVAKNDYFFQIWNQERIKWRINNPYNKVTIYNEQSKLKFISSSVFSFIKTFAYLDNKNYSYILLEENFSVPKIRWKGVNLYYIDSDNFELISLSQSVSPFRKNVTLYQKQKRSNNAPF